MADSCDNSQSRLIINYLPQDLTDGLLLDIFSRIGQIESCKIMRDFKTGYSYGFGFVTYVDPQNAQKAIKQLNGLEISTKRIKVSLARPPGEKIKDTNLYITNLPSHITEDGLQSMFGRFGTIVQKNILTNKQTGISRGVAFVRYDNKEEAQQAIDVMHNSTPPGGSAPLVVRIADEHGKQKAAYYAGMQAGMMQNHQRPPNNNFNNYGGNNFRGRVHTVGWNNNNSQFNMQNKRGNNFRGRVHTVGWNNNRQFNNQYNVQYNPYDY